MAFKSLRDYLEALEKKGELRKVEAEVDSYLEITEIANRVVKKGGPALLFKKVKNSPFPLVINIFGTWERTKFALGDPEKLAEKVKSILSLTTPAGWKEMVKQAPNISRLLSLKPKTVKKAPCQEVVLEGEKADLKKLPVLHCWPLDGGPFITLPLVITRDPENGELNVGMYRLQVFDSRTTGLHWHRHKDAAKQFRKLKKGEKFPVAIALGADPATIYAATAPLPAGLNEFGFAGFLRGEKVEVTKALTSDLLVPAEAEFVLEGYAVKGEEKLEGPFGDHTGFYSLADQYPVFHLEIITHRRQPIYPATIVGQPPMEDAYLGKFTERLFLPLIKLYLPEIVDINLPIEGVFHNLAIVSIKKEYPGQARKIMHALWGLGQMSFTKVIIVVDEDVDVHNLSEVRWRALNNIDPERDIEIVKGPVDVLDHAAPYPCYGSKMGIDATFKFKEEGLIREFPPVIKMDKKIIEKVDKRWKEYGIETD